MEDSSEHEENAPHTDWMGGYRYLFFCFHAGRFLYQSVCRSFSSEYRTKQRTFGTFADTGRAIRSFRKSGHLCSDTFAVTDANGFSDTNTVTDANGFTDTNHIANADLIADTNGFSDTNTVTDADDFTDADTDTFGVELYDACGFYKPAHP